MRSFLCYALLVLSNTIFVTAEEVKVSVNLQNDNAHKLELKWVNPQTRETTLMLYIEPAQRTSIFSYEGHEFEVRELPSAGSGVCYSKDKICQVSTFKVAAPPENTFAFKAELEIVEVAEKGKEQATVQPILEPAELLAKCQSEAKKNLASANNDAEKEAKIMEGFNACLKHGLLPTLIQADNEIQFEKILRETAATEMENVTCADPDSVSSPDVDQLHWTSEKDGVTRLVHVKMDRLASRVHVVEDFVSPEECAAMEENASTRLSRAAVSDGKGGSQVGINRKALQAGIVPDFSKEKDGDPIARLSRRVYDYTNRVLGLDITEHGQEPLMSIQYFGRGYNDTEPDRYTPHCDASCDGTSHLHGARVASLVMYCTIPEKGGHTNFQNAGIHVKPELGSGLFFSYIDPATNGTDFGFTQHSGCPVYEGEKKIITQWVRYGVDAQTSHGSFNTLGIKRSEDGE